MKKISLFITFLLISVAGKSQTIDNVFEDDLVRIGREILENPEYRKRFIANFEFEMILKDYVSTNEGFDDNLDAVSNMLRLEGEDFRIFTWQMPDSNFNYTRHGLIATKNKEEEIKITSLEDKSSTLQQAQFQILKPENWYGALYYKIIPQKEKGREIYTLLGFAPNSDLNKKIIDVIEIDEKGKPRFGAKIFKIEEFQDQVLQQAPMRLILQYGGDVSASVRWNESEEMIVMDHLSPPDVKMKGVYQLYGPTMTYDALVWKKGWWELEKLVDFNSRQEIEIRPPNKGVDLGGG